MGEIISISTNGMRQEAARERIRAFGEQFGTAHLFFAQHAAFPLALTSDLLYRLWANFQRNIVGEKLHIPWIAVADLLLSSLCEEVGHELYEIDITLRVELLTALKTNPAFGQRRIRELSYFLLDYVRQQLQSNNSNVRHFAQAQRWTALAYIQPGHVAYELAETLRALDRNNRIERIRVLSLIEAFGRLSEPLATLEAFTPLLTYARGIDHMASKAVGGARDLSNALPQVRPAEQGSGISLPTEEKREKHQEASSKIQDTRKNFFISYHEADSDWAKWIAWQLEEVGYSVLLQSWNFSAEANFSAEVDTIAQLAQYVVVILSPDYLEAFARRPGWAEAFWQDPRNSPGFMIAFQVRDCQDILNDTLGFVIYTNLVGQDENAAREVLLARISRPGLTTTTSQSDRPRVILEHPLFPVLMQNSLSLDSRKVVEILISYACEDEEYLETLEKCLAALKLSRQIIWHTREVEAEVDWASISDAHMNTANIILLLISPDFLNSDYCSGVEIQRALYRQVTGEARVIPVILRPCLWQKTLFGKIQAFPRNGIPISKCKDRDEAFMDLLQETIDFVEQPPLLSLPKRREQWKAEGDAHFAAHRYKEALTAYNQALALDPDDDTYINIGHSYYNLRDFENAIDSYQAALQIDTLDTHPIKWAAMQTHLGDTYLAQTTDERQTNLEKALDHYTLASQIYTPEAFPTQWAELQISLGDLHSVWTKGNRQANLEIAINCYQSALQIYTRESFPSQWSELQQKLGDTFVTFSELPDADEQANLEQAITYYEEVSPFESYIDVEEVATDNAFEEDLFNKLAQEIISSFSAKMRAALLTDLANRMSFDEQPTLLQQAFLNVGIELQNYRRSLPTTAQERSRNVSLLAHAYKRLRKLAEQ